MLKLNNRRRYGIIKDRLWGVFSALFLMTLALPVSGRAVGTERIVCDLQACIDFALDNVPSLQAAAARNLATESAKENIRSNFRPRLGMRANTILVDGEPTGLALIGIFERGLIKERTFDTIYTLSFGVTYPLLKEGVLFGIDAPSIEQAEARLKGENAAYQITRNDMIYDVSQVYFEAFAATKVMKITGRILNLGRRDYETAQVKFQQELISKNDLLLMETNLVAQKSSHATAQNSLKLAQMKLAKTIGSDLRQEIQIRNERWPTHVLPELNDLIGASSQRQRPEIIMQKSKVRETQAALLVARSARAPTLNFSSKYTFASANDLERLAQGWLATIELQQSLLDFGATSAKITEAESNLREQEKNLLQLKLTFSFELAQAYTKIKNEENNLRLIRKRIEQTKEALKLADAKFQLDLIPQVEVFSVGQELLRREKELIQTQYDLQIGYLQLNKATGSWDQ